MSILYVLLLEDNKYYVGQTDGVTNRISDIVAGNGPAWTKLHKFVKVLTTSDDAIDKNNLIVTQSTELLMQKYGIENVRGGLYSHVNLSSSEVLHLEKLFRYSRGDCMKCGYHGHFAENCTNVISDEIEFGDIITYCAICGRKHYTAECMATTTRYGRPIRESPQFCERCGWSTHLVDECYARTDCEGNSL